MYTLIWYAFYDHQPGNGVDHISYNLRAHTGHEEVIRTTNTTQFVDYVRL